ncbi:MAG: aspartate aminotransferase family protein [Nitratireductor sp.]|nr:aspartate aminotransferase family protein [Nitratireductor sp.]
MTNREETLDPKDWEAFRSLSHRIVDEATDYLRDVRDRPVWQSMPEDVRQAFTEPLPVEGEGLASVYAELTANLMAYPMGNIHPRFWMWYMGSSNATGALGDYLAAVIGSNLGGGDHAAALVDNQVVGWCRQMMGLPEGSSGTLTSGGSMANIIALTVARNVMAGALFGIDLREEGVAALAAPLRFYASDQVHSCHQKGVELLGLGNKALHRVASKPDFTIDIHALARAIVEDRAAGFTPACVIATAGTVNTGAIDDLKALRELCDREGLWLHVDGCIGALIAIAPENRHLVAGIEKADSIALDPHKWLHAPFEVGCVLVRDGTAHHSTFALTPEYLEATPRGIASAHWLHEYGPQTSRGFRALKVWMALKEHGVGKFGRLIDQNIAQAHYLAGLVEADDRLELVAPVTVNIVCFRYNPGDLDEAQLKKLNTEIMLRLQEAGTAALSDTTIGRRHCLRPAITNHRTRYEDLDLLTAETCRLGDELVAEGFA